MRVSILLAAVLLLSGCASLLPERDQVQVFRIGAPESALRRDVAFAHVLLVDEPLASRPLQSDRIVVYPEPNLLQFYAAARWAVRPPQLVQEQLIEAIEAAGLFDGVRRRAGAADGDWVLEGELREFQAVYLDGPEPVTRIRLRLELVERRSGRRIAAREFVDVGQPAGSSTLAVVRSLDAGMQRVLVEVLDWLERQGEAAGQPS